MEVGRSREGFWRSCADRRPASDVGRPSPASPVSGRVAAWSTRRGTRARPAGDRHQAAIRIQQHESPEPSARSANLQSRRARPSVPREHGRPSRRAAAIGEIVLPAQPDGSLLRIRDLARVELGAQDYKTFSRFDKSQPAWSSCTSPPEPHRRDCDRVRRFLDDARPGFPAGSITASAWTPRAS